MRLVYLALLLVIASAVVVFAVQNNAEVRLDFLNWGLNLPLSVLIGAVYVLGMVSGWTVVGFIRRSLQRVTERRRKDQ
jgi:uncharacterized integral membrane protein